MADEVLKRDQNHVTVAGAVTNDADLEVTMLRVDPVTGYVLISEMGSVATSGIASQIASRDGNHAPVCMGWDETNQVLQEILTDENGYLLVEPES